MEGLSGDSTADTIRKVGKEVLGSEFEKLNPGRNLQGRAKKEELISEMRAAIAAKSRSPGTGSSTRISDARTPIKPKHSEDSLSAENTPARPSARPSPMQPRSLSLAAAVADVRAPSKPTGPAAEAKPRPHGDLSRSTPPAKVCGYTKKNQVPCGSPALEGKEGLCGRHYNSVHKAADDEQLRLDEIRRDLIASLDEKRVTRKGSFHFPDLGDSPEGMAVILSDGVGVRNAVNTSRDNEHSNWQGWHRECTVAKLQGREPGLTCCIRGCGNLAVVGGHIYCREMEARQLSAVSTRSSTHKYLGILPICKRHNWRKKEEQDPDFYYPVKGGSVLVVHKVAPCVIPRGNKFENMSSEERKRDPTCPALWRE